MLLAGDIGGTKTVLALYAPERGPRHPIATTTFSSKQFDSLEAIVDSFLQETGQTVTHAAFGVAGPVMGKRVEITNLPWIIEESRLRRALDLQAVHLLNDLEAIATAVPILEQTDLHTLREGIPAPQGAIGVLAPGTGLGEAFLVWDGRRHRAFPSEGSHADFAPVGELQRELLAHLQPQHGHVSYERVCSGIGIPNLYAFLRDTGRYEEPAWLAQELAQVQDATPVIVNAAQEEQADLCTATLDLFIDILAREAGNLALKILARGGVYLGGGIPPRILKELEASNFLQAFGSKGRFRDLLSNVPIHVICREDTALLGVAFDGLRMMSDPSA